MADNDQHMIAKIDEFVNELFYQYKKSKIFAIFPNLDTDTGRVYADDYYKATPDFTGETIQSLFVLDNNNNIPIRYWLLNGQHDLFNIVMGKITNTIVQDFLSNHTSKLLEFVTFILTDIDPNAIFYIEDYCCSLKGKYIGVSPVTRSNIIKMAQIAYQVRRVLFKNQQSNFDELF